MQVLFQADNISHDKINVLIFVYALEGADHLKEEGMNKLLNIQFKCLHFISP